MDRYVVTISRRFGSMGHEISARLGEKLQVPVYDRAGIEALVKEQNLEVKLQAERMRTGVRKESPASAIDRLWRKRDREIPPTDEDQIHFDAQSMVIRQLVSKESCIILGRCADQILKDHPRCMNVFLFAPDEVRLKNCVELLHTDEEAARALIRREDSAREAYRGRFCPDRKDETSGRHLMIDTSFLGVEETAALLEHAVRCMFEA